MSRLALAALLLLPALCGCTAWNNTVLSIVSSGSPELPADAWDKVDGNYKGFAVLAAAATPACPPTNFGKIEIGDQRLYFAYQPDTIFVAPIQPDGSLHAIAGNAILDGMIADGRLAFTIHTPVCQSHYDMRYVI